MDTVGKPEIKLVMDVSETLVSVRASRKRPQGLRLGAPGLIVPPDPFGLEIGLDNGTDGSPRVVGRLTDKPEVDDTEIEETSVAGGAGIRYGSETVR